MDKDGDGVGGPGEVDNRTKGGIPTIAEVGLGKNGGKLIILADPSMFINDLLELNGNLQFTLDMVEYLAKGTPKETTIIFEESRHLQPTIFTSIYVELFGWLAYGTGSLIVKIITLSALILGLEFVLMRIANPTLYRHVFNPSWGRTSRWRIPHTHYLHPDTVRETLLERIRIMHGLPREDFKVLPPMELEGMVREPALVGFLLNKDNKIPLEDVLQAMDRLSK